jgi:large subunit ribosomal protein L6
MSRIGRQPIQIPDGVQVDVAEGNVVTVTGPRGTLSQTMHQDISIVRDDRVLRVERSSDDGFHRGLHGLTRTLIFNMVEGVTRGFEKRLQIVGVGYRAALKGKDLEVSAGYSHPVVVSCPEGIEFEVPTATSIVIKGNDKQAVGEIAANIRKIRKPEPYKGKGIRYEGEYVRKKAGKAAKGAA